MGKLRSAVVTLIDRIRQLESRLLPFEMRLVESQSTLTRWVDPEARGLKLEIGMTGTAAECRGGKRFALDYGLAAQQNRSPLGCVGILRP